MKKIINYVGVDPKVGTTMVASCMANYLKKEGKDVVLLTFEEEYGKVKTYLWEDKDYHPNEVARLLDSFSEDYVIVDSGSDFNSGLVIGTLENSDVNQIVVTQQKKSQVKLDQLLTDVIFPLKIEPGILLNKYVQGFKEVDCENRLSYCPYGWEAEEEGKTLLKYPKFSKDFKKYERAI
ncbi:MAG: hypothetical protein MJ146_03290 [Clostridia bacterium]|nr:hypothetical protein [Clostridia bacterium]